MILFKKAVQLVNEYCRSGGSEPVETPEAYGRVLNEDVRSEVDIPAFDNSAMDGYAIKSEDTVRVFPDNPVTLEVTGDEASAGAPQYAVTSPGTALPIMTGGIIPYGADAVVQLEHVKTEKLKITVTKPVPRGMHIRRKGEDIKVGSIVLKNGTCLNPGSIAQLIAIGKSKVKVGRKPKVGILATGNELIDYDQPNPGNKIFSCNTYLLSSQVLGAGGEPINLGIARDTLIELKSTIEAGLEKSDIFITTGGISVGKYDLVKKVMLDLGVKEIFHKVRIKPGKPIFFGIYRDKPVFALPGNPASASVTFDLFVSAAIEKFQGSAQGSLETRQAVLAEDLRKKSGRRHFLRGRTKAQAEKVMVSVSGHQGSGNVSSLAAADCYIVLPEETTEQKAGSLVRIYSRRLN